MTITSPEAVIAIRANIEQAIATYDACIAGPTADDTILAWESCLAVVWVNGAAGASATGPHAATAFTRGKGEFAYPVVMNGHRETAVPRRRGDVCVDAANRARELLVELLG